MESEPYDVVLLPEQDLSNLAIQTSKDLEKYGTYFTLSSDVYFPHLSLYMLQLDQMALAETLKLVEKIASETGVINVKVKDYHYSHDYLDIEYDKTEILENIQNKIISTLNPMRCGLRKNDENRLQNAEGDELFNILNYGYRSVGKLFAPHLTFTRFKESQKQVIAVLPQTSLFNGNFNAIGIFGMGDNGTCVNEIARFMLSETN